MPRDFELTPFTRARAARLVISEHSVVRDRTAAWIWGVSCFGFAELDGTPPIEYCVLRGHEPTDRAEVSGITRDLVPSDWIEIDGAPGHHAPADRTRPRLLVGTPRRARGHGRSLRRHGFTQHEMRVLLRRYRRRRGVVQLRRLVAAADPRAESQPESWVRWFIIQAEMARPTPQVWVTIEGREIRLDLAYPRARIAVEYDGEEFHTAPQQRVHDGERRAALRRAGWIVIVVTRAGLTLDGRDVWLSALSEALRVRRVR